MRGVRRSASVGLLLLIALAACMPATGRRVPDSCEFPEGARLSFAGETTMAELWIPAPGSEHETVYAWVTADPVWPTRPGVFERVACVEVEWRSFTHSIYPGSLYQRSLPSG